MMNRTLTYWLAGLLLWLPFLPLSAQKEAVAKEVLDKTASAFRKAGGVEASFTLTTYSHGSPQGETKGTIRLMGERFRLDTPGVVTWFDGKTQWSYLPANEEVNVANPTREELQSINPLSFLSLYKQGYACRMGATETYAGKPVHEVCLTAEDFERPISNLTLYIDRVTLFPIYIKVKEAGQNYNVITVANYASGKDWRTEDFRFDPKQYPDAEVIDLR